MAFIADNVAMRTFDAERGLELFTRGGSHLGSQHFVLKGADFELPFSAVTSSEPIDGVDQTLHPAISSTMIWHVYKLLVPVPGCSMNETHDLVSEALIAFIGAHGFPSGQAVAVLSLPVLNRQD